MWCIPKVTPEFIERMEHILDIYAKPYNPIEPLICFDEKNTQLLEDTRPTVNVKEGSPRKRDYEYKRNGTANIFVTVEPKAGFRTTSVTKRRTDQDFAHEIRRIIDMPRYNKAKRIHIVLDNLNTHFEKSFYKTFPKMEVDKILKKIKFHYTPKHASWLNMAEVEIGILTRQSLRRRAGNFLQLKNNIHHWEKARNKQKSKIKWGWTKKDARKVFKYTPTKLN